MKILFALVFALGLSACVSNKHGNTQKQVKCGHLEICHADHHHHNSRHHHDGRQGAASEQNEAEQTLQ